MALTGKLYINGSWQEGTAGTYQAINPATREKLAPVMTHASVDQVEQAVAAAQVAFEKYRQTTLQERAEFLRTCADEIMALGDELLERITAETGYPRGRGENERGRTCNQLRLFADTIEQGDYLEARIDTALPDRQPLPRPDIRSVKVPMGPVVVFGASNFPMAFSVAGGDTAAALAAGCPVLVKGHSSHPGTSELVAQAMARAVEKCGMPAGVFSLIMGAGSVVGSALVKADAVKAVGFTGSYAGGMALVKLANERAEPIPVFAEMGSVNPVVLLPQALRDNAEKIAEGFVASLTLGTGQFCVNPGLVIALDDAHLTQFIDATAKNLEKVGAGVMLNERISTAYSEGLTSFLAHNDVEQIAAGACVTDEPGFVCQAALLATNASSFLNNPHIQEEIFGPVSLVVKCKNLEEVKQVVASLKGQLTGTIHCSEGELADQRSLAETLQARVGRLVVNGFPTGVEVCHAMVHGGPFPASTDARFTSVGTAAIQRFIRPVCFQNYPEALLPDALRNENPLKLRRLVNGRYTAETIA